MEQLEFKISKGQFDDFFGSIRTRFDVIVVWMRIIKQIIIYHHTQKFNETGKIYFFKNNINLVFLSGNNRLSSLNFPFKILYEDNLYHIYTKSLIEIDSKISSDIIALFVDDFSLNKYNFSFEQIFDFCLNYDNAWKILRDILFSECGYIRFDNDPARAKANIHPINHFDICYTDNSSYKLGIDFTVTLSEFKDILDKSTNCYFLQKRI